MTEQANTPATEEATPNPLGQDPPTSLPEVDPPADPAILRQQLRQHQAHTSPAPTEETIPGRGAPSGMCVAAQPADTQRAGQENVPGDHPPPPAPTFHSIQEQIDDLRQITREELIEYVNANYMSRFTRVVLPSKDTSTQKYTTYAVAR